MNASAIASTALFSLGFIASAAAWEIQSALPLDRNINGIAFVSPSHGYLCGENRHLLETLDGGATWQIRMGDEIGTDPFYVVEFADALHGYMVGNSNDAYRTSDGGVTWVPTGFMPAGSWRLLDFITPTSGFAGANGALVYTANGGATWTVRSGYPDCPVLYGMDFRDANVGLGGGTVVATNEAGIWKTTDGGRTWSRRHPASANDVLWIGATTALAIVGTDIYRSSNAGDTWSLYAAGIWTGLVDLELADVSVVIGVSGKGDVWRSSDAGLTWNMVVDGVGNLPAPWSVDFVDALNGWVAGQGGTLMQTSDGGRSWRLRSSGVSIQLYDVEMLGEHYGLVAGHDGYLLRTTDGGAFWETQKLEVTGQIFGRDEGLKAVSIVDRDFAVTAGPGGTVFRTLNGGTDWESIGFPTLPGTFYIEDVKFTDRSHGWLVGLDTDYGHDRTVYRTTDGGATWWQPFGLGNRAISVDFVDPQYGWIATITPHFLRTTDGGASWTPLALPVGAFTPTINAIRFATRTEGWAVGWDGYVAHTTNGGVSWTFQTLPGTGDVILGIRPVSATDVWLTGRDAVTWQGIVYRTTNAGTTWEKEVVGDYPYIPVGVAALPGGATWVAGYAGRILHRTGATLSAGDPSGPENARIARIAPNPVQGRATIRLQLPAPGHLVIRIHDLAGRVVEELANRTAAPGAGEMIWEAENHRADTPPGVYFCRIAFTPFEPARQVAITEVHRLVRLP